MKDAIAALAEAKVHRDQLEKIYVTAMDFRVVDALTDRVRSELLEWSARREG
jgi:hypothetical protein